MKNLFIGLLFSFLLFSCAEESESKSGFFYDVQGQGELKFGGLFDASQESKDTAVLQIIAPAKMQINDVLAVVGESDDLCSCLGIKTEILAMNPDSIILAGGKVSQQIIGSSESLPSTYWVIQLLAVKKFIRV